LVSDPAPRVETVGEVAQHCPRISPDTTVPRLEYIFRTQQGIRAVAVPTPRGLGLLSRARFHAILSGELGYGRALLSRARVSKIVDPADLTLPATMTLVLAAAAVVARTGEHRYDDVLVLRDDGSAQSVPVATLLEEVGLRFREIALRDPLTGLGNRRMLDEYGLAIGGNEADAARLALLYVDLDGFKQVNDSLGHRAGDELLTEFAARLTASVRSGDLVGRLGGDEFAVLLTDASDAEAMAIADRIVRVAATAFVVGGQLVSLSASVGVALWEDVREQTGLSALDVLLRHADGAMLHAKRAGKARAGRLQGPQWADLPARRAAIRRRLAVALAEDLLELHYQPKLDLRTGTMTSVEALIRWTDAELGPVSPGELIPVAESSGQIYELGRWVVRAACAQALAWHREGRPWAIAVNVSPVELADPHLAAGILATVEAHGLPPGLLHVEVTESSVMADLEVAQRQLATLEAAAVQVHLDDFGAGYSSLSRLRTLPLSSIKIDRSIVGRIDTDPADAQLLAGVINAAHTLGLTVVAEGVERPTQLDQLRALGCDLAQGYLLGRPCPADVVRGGSPLRPMLVGSRATCG